MAKRPRSNASAHDATVQEAGVTLLETLLVLVVLAVAALLAYPRFAGSRQSATFKATTTEIASGLKATRAAAISSSRAHTFIIDPASRRFWADGAAKERRVPAGVSVAVATTEGGDDPQGSEALLPDPLRPAAILFRPDGSAMPGKIVVSSGRQVAHIRVDWLTGRVSVEYMK